jgi:flagellar basal-body rod protein FlgB
MLTTSATTEMLARAIDVCALRQAVYSANIANANVAGYKRMEVSFDEQLLRAESATGRSIFGYVSEATSVQPQLIASSNSTVKLDEEMALMASNALRYQTLLGAYERSIGLLKLAIHEGRGV